MKFQVLLHPKANDFLKKLDKNIKKRVIDRLKGLEKTSHKRKRLTYSNYFSLRVGDYRVIYEVHNEDEKIIVLFIGHRRNVYDDFSKLI